MNNIEESLERVFCWTESQLPAAIALHDITTAQRLVVLGTLCMGEHGLHTPILAEAMALIDTYCSENAQIHNDVATNFQYGLAVQRLTGAPPAWLERVLGRYAAVAEDDSTYWSNEQLAPTLLLLYRLLNKNNPDKVSTPVRTVSAAVLLQNDRKEIWDYIGHVDTHVNFGVNHSVAIPQDILSVLEIKMLAAARTYDLELTTHLLRLLTHAGSISAVAKSTVIRFLLCNQSMEGFFGYYDKEFEAMGKENRKFNKLDYLISTTMLAVIALRESSSKFRFYRDMGAAKPAEHAAVPCEGH